MFDFIHPMIVHFPIALIIVAFLSEFTGAVLRREFFTKVALLLLVLGTLGAIAAYFSGGFAEEDLVSEAGALGAALEEHEEAGEAALWVMIVVAGIRMLLAYKHWLSGWRQWLAVIILAIGTGAVARTGYLGGELVFKHAAGVQLEPGSHTPAVDSAGSTENDKDDD